MTTAEYTLKNGGGTFEADTLRPVEPTAGYAVALAEGSAAMVRLHDEDRLLRIEIDYVRDEHPTAPYIGTWVEHGATGSVIHVDPVVILPDRESALLLAAALGQKAVWDFGAGSEVYVEGEAA